MTRASAGDVFGDEKEEEAVEAAAGRVEPPLRSTIPEGGLKLERLLDELSGNDGGEMSNRAKFRALPIDPGIMARIRKYQVTSTASTAGRTTRLLRNRNEIN